jgi:hypothetical protein
MTAFTASDQFARRVVSHLDAGARELPHDVTQRLRVARQQALERRRAVAAMAPRVAPTVLAAGSALVLGSPDGPTWWQRIGGLLPLIALVLGLVAVKTIQDQARASEVAEIDAALLVDDLPPAAYTDAGFLQFLKQQAEQAARD